MFYKDMNTSARSTLTRRRLISATVLMFLAATFVLSSFGQGPLAPSGQPAPTMKSLQDVWDKLGVLEAQNQSQIQAHSRPRNFQAAAEVVGIEPGTHRCAPVQIPAGETVKLQSVAAITTNDSGAAAYVKFNVKSGPSKGQIMAQRIALASTGDDPVNNTRSAVLEIPILVSGGRSFETAAIGEVYFFEVCARASANAPTNGSFLVTGTYE